MKAIGFNGKEYVWNLTKYDVYHDDTRKRSKHHLAARKILREIYSSYRILEEVKLPGSTSPNKRSVLYLDFFIPNVRRAFEVHGQQHYEHTPFFHKNKADFIRAKARDEDKIEWCKLNNIELTVLKYSETDDEWKRAIRGC